MGARGIDVVICARSGSEHWLPSGIGTLAYHPDPPLYGRPLGGVSGACCTYASAGCRRDAQPLGWRWIGLSWCGSGGRA
jgi:hypothetical protein